MKNNGHVLATSLNYLKIRIVELWRCKILTGSVPWDYQDLMTACCKDYQVRTGESCDTVASITPLEEWYDNLSNAQKEAMKTEYAFVPVP